MMDNCPALMLSNSYTERGMGRAFQRRKVCVLISNNAHTPLSVKCATHCDVCPMFPGCASLYNVSGITGCSVMNAAK